MKIDYKQLAEWTSLTHRLVKARNSLTSASEEEYAVCAAEKDSAQIAWEQAACSAFLPLMDEVLRLTEACEDYEARIADISEASGPGDPDYIEERIMALRTIAEKQQKEST